MSEQNATVEATNEQDAGATAACPLVLLIAVGRSDRPLDPQPRVLDLCEVDEVCVGRGTGDGVTSDGRVMQLSLADPWVSGQHARIQRVVSATGFAFRLEDHASRNGTLVRGKRVAQHFLRDGDVVEIGHRFFRFLHQRVASGRAILDRAGAGGEGGTATSVCPVFLELLSQAERIAPTRISVVLQGESGTGKEVLAGIVHRASGRPGRLVALNCAAVPEALLESELFGHKKGAFTGAIADKEGLVEAAEGGTLFLDEIGDMPAAAQAKVLRLVQECTFFRVGETTPRRADVRFVAASHRDLESMVRAEAFRGDLLARLNGITLRLPALRDRREDIGLLLAAFLRSRAGSRIRAVDHDAYRALLLHDWPFNIRELGTSVETAVALARGDRIALADLHGLSGEPPPAGEPRPTVTPRIRRGASDDELREAIQGALVRHRGNVAAVARELRHTPKQIHRWMSRVGLEPGRFRG
jgi:DNA-binding NtrC family response regulator